jgi:integrase
MQRSGIELTFHGLRHGYASLMLAAGVPLKIVSEQIGHANIGITGDLYTHVADDLRRQAADQLNTLLMPHVGGTRD